MPTIARARLAIATPLLAAALILPATASAATQTLTVEKQGTGTGTVTSSPAGIGCGATCSAPFTEGSTVALSGAPGTNTAEVIWAGCTSVNLENKCFVKMSEAKTVTATFNLQQRPLSVSKKGTGTGTVSSSPAGIECGATCSANFTRGHARNPQRRPRPQLPGGPVVGAATRVNGEGKCVVTMSVAKAVTATFNLVSHQLTVSKAGTGTGTVTSSPAGIECGASCAASFEHGTTRHPDRNPGPSLRPRAVVGLRLGQRRRQVHRHDERRQGGNRHLPPPAPALGDEDGQRHRTVTSSPSGIECGPTCSAFFPKSSSVTLTGTAGLHSQAVKWTNCDSVNGQNKCIVTMSAAKAVSAGFELEPQWIEYTVSVEKSGSGQGTVTSSPGSISCGAICSGQFVTATKATFTASPAPGSVFAHFSGGGCVGAGPCTTTVKGPKTIKAVFTAVGLRTLSVAKAGTGQGTVTARAFGINCGATCSAQVPAAKKVTLSAKPAKGSAFAGWSGACSGAARTCRVAMNEARALIASFDQLPAPLPSPSTLAVAGSAKVKGAKAQLRLSCKGGSACKGTLKLRAKLKNAKGKAKGALIGSASFSLAPGATRTLGVALSPKAMRAAQKRRAPQGEGHGSGDRTARREAEVGRLPSASFLSP